MHFQMIIQDSTYLILVTEQQTPKKEKLVFTFSRLRFKRFIFKDSLRTAQ